MAPHTTMTKTKPLARGRRLWVGGNMLSVMSRSSCCSGPSWHSTQTATVKTGINLPPTKTFPCGLSGCAYCWGRFLKGHKHQETISERILCGEVAWPGSMTLVSLWLMRNSYYYFLFFFITGFPSHPSAVCALLSSESESWRSLTLGTGSLPGFPNCFTASFQGP